MDLSSRGIASMVYKPIIRSGFGRLHLDGKTLSALMMMDGQKTLGQVAQETGILLAGIRQIISKLVQLRLVERIEKTVSIVDQEFFDFLVFRMSLAVGPLGEIIVEDGLEDLGFNRDNFPSFRTAELVNHLSREIQREEKCHEFKQVMLRKIRDRRFLD
jgi:hypothetical protein